MSASDLRAPGVRRRAWPATRRLPRGESRHSSWKVLQDHGFRSYFAGSLVSNLGTWLQNTAQVLLAYQLTHSVFAVGVVTCAQFAGSLLLGPWAAVLADRIGGKRMLIGTQLLSATIAGGLAGLQAAGFLGEKLLIIGALGLGLAFSFALPVQTALVPRLAPRADTKAALAMNSVSYNAGRALAPALCVAVITASGFALAFALNAISFVVFAAILAKTRPRADGKPAQPARARDGVRIAVQHPRIMLLLAMVSAVTIADDPVLVLGPALARHVLGVSNDWAGYFLAALGWGTVLGSLMPARRPASRNASRTSAWSLLALVISITVFAAGFSTWASLVAALAAGAAALLTGATIQTLLVQQQPESAASVMALWAIAWAGTKPIASLADGWLASTTGTRLAGFLLTVPALVLALFEICLPENSKKRIKGHARRWADQRTAAAPLSLPPARRRRRWPLEPPGSAHYACFPQAQADVRRTSGTPCTCREHENSPTPSYARTSQAIHSPSPPDHSGRPVSTVTSHDVRARCPWPGRFAETGPVSCNDRERR